MSRDYHTRSRDHKADIMASAELSLLEAELTTALEQCIGAHFEESESRLDVKRTRWLISTVLTPSDRKSYRTHTFVIPAVT